jgi:hypothetical protein
LSQRIKLILKYIWTVDKPEVQKLKGIFIEMNGPDTKTKPAKVLCKTQKKIKGKQ